KNYHTDRNRVGISGQSRAVHARPAYPHRILPRKLNEERARAAATGAETRGSLRNGAARADKEIGRQPPPGPLGRSVRTSRRRRPDMPRPGCRRRRLSLGRRFLCDYLHFSGRGHTAAAERLMRLPDVVAARRQASPRPSWGAIMTKAFALAARNHPELRRAYFSFPWGHLGEYDAQVASVIVSRRVGDDEAIFLAPLVSPAC